MRDETPDGPARPKPYPGSEPATRPIAVVDPPPRPVRDIRPAPRPVAGITPAPRPAVAAKPTSVATLERPAPREIASVVLDRSPVEAPSAPSPPSRPGLAARVAALPRVLLETVAWGGFAAVVALVVIALSDVGMGRAALWAVCLSGIVVLAVAVMAVTGTHLDELNSAGKAEGRPD